MIERHAQQPVAPRYLLAIVATAISALLFVAPAKAETIDGVAAAAGSGAEGAVPTEASPSSAPAPVEAAATSAATDPTGAAAGGSSTPSSPVEVPVSKPGPSKAPTATPSSVASAVPDVRSSAAAGSETTPASSIRRVSKVADGASPSLRHVSEFADGASQSVSHVVAGGASSLGQVPKPADDALQAAGGPLLDVAAPLRDTLASVAPLTVGALPLGDPPSASGTSPGSGPFLFTGAPPSIGTPSPIGPSLDRRLDLPQGPVAGSPGAEPSLPGTVDAAHFIGPPPTVGGGAGEDPGAIGQLNGPTPLDGPAPQPGFPAAAGSGSGSSFFVPIAALLALLALVVPAIVRRLREAPGFSAPTPFVCALERPG